jgi:signal transduction histidine kinase
VTAADGFAARDSLPLDGLAIAHSLIDLHGGGIEAASPGEGRGTTVTVRLPVLKSTQPVSAEHAR